MRSIEWQVAQTCRYTWKPRRRPAQSYEENKPVCFQSTSRGWTTSSDRSVTAAAVETAAEAPRAPAALWPCLNWKKENREGCGVRIGREGEITFAREKCVCCGRWNHMKCWECREFVSKMEFLHRNLGSKRERKISRWVGRKLFCGQPHSLGIHVDLWLVLLGCRQNCIEQSKGAKKGTRAGTSSDRLELTAVRNRWAIVASGISYCGDWCFTVLVSPRQKANESLQNDQHAEMSVTQNAFWLDSNHRKRQTLIGSIPSATVSQ